MLRTILERISRGVVLKRKIIVNKTRCPIYVTPDAQLKYLSLQKNAFDADLINLAEKFVKRSSVVWDIGANVGIFTFASASIATQGTIVAVEADIWLASILRKTARLPAYKNSQICIVPVAVSDQSSIQKFLIATRGRAANALASVGGRSQMGGIRETHYTPSLTLDSLLDVFPVPSFIKIDIEGAELLSLLGATNILSKARPSLYIETANKAEEIIALLASYNYFPQALDGSKIQKPYPYNILFMPQEAML
tara:strand:+ start:1969 stop:2724 length:756 start_codon:yes stop_codon:yes gene_type:complete